MSKELLAVNELIGMRNTWDDLVGSLIARRLESIAGGLNYNYTENSITMDSGGDISVIDDRLVFNFQYPHACVVDGVMKLHMHFEQVSSNVLEFTTQYRVQHNGEAKTTDWTTVTANTTDDVIYTYVSGTLNQIIALAEIPLTDAGLSATVEFRVARTDSTTGSIEAVFIDAHVLRDMTGSRTEYVK